MNRKKISKKNTTEYKIAESVSVVSHQLKTPLSGIKGYLEVLITEDLGKLNKEQKEYLKDVLENTNRMIDLVKDVLEVARIEANRIEIRPQPTDLAEIIKETMEELSVFARAHNCELSFEILDKIPSVNVDPIKIKAVITNIISNAIFYNKRKGKAEIFLSKKRKKVIFWKKVLI